ncbi:Uncharacterised protein [Klebsiella pneumoniae]|nr:Uncharacterised protein [Klebsiella pneumoniae]
MQLGFLQCVTLNLLRQQVTLGNVEFLIFRITGQTDHFHTIQQRCRNIHGVGCRDKHDVGQIVIHFQVVIVKRDILFRIQHLKQCGSRITAHIR